MAGIQDSYPFLPGHLVEFKDGGMKISTDPNPPTTESVLILGTATDGPVYEVVEVDPTTVEMIFGKAATPDGRPNGATLVVGFEEAYAAGCRSIKLMRISGEKAKGKLRATAQATNNIEVFEEQLGLAAGNVATTITLANKNVDPASIKVYAKGVELPATAFQHETDQTTGDEKVTILADVCDAMADITISYKYEVSGTTFEVSENGIVDPVSNTFTLYVAEGADQIFTLTHTPTDFTLMANGVVVLPDNYTISGNTLTLKPGAVAMRALLEASYTYTDTVVVEPEIEIESVFAGSVYNGVKRKVENILSANGSVIGKKIIFVKPPAKRATLSEKPLEYSSLDYPRFADLVEAVNSDPNNNIVRLVCRKEWEDIATDDLVVTPEEPLIGGNDGIRLTKEQLYERLAGKRDASGKLISRGAFHLLEGVTVDYVVPMGVYADDKLIGGKSFAYELGLACAVMSHRNHVTHGIIATSSPSLPTLEGIADHVDKLVSEAKLYYMKDNDGNIISDAEGNKIDLGMYISILAAPDVRINNSRFGVYATNSPAIYAGMLSTLPVRSSPMNKEVPGILGLRYTLSNAQVNALLAAGYVTYEVKDNGRRVVVADAPTAAAPTSDYHELVSFRAVKAAADAVREAAEPFRGESNDVANRNAMTSAIDKRLASMKESGDIQGYEFRVISTLADQILGKATIELTIVPPMTLKKITTIVSLTPSL